jgi:hypothetical protein
LAGLDLNIKTRRKEGKERRKEDRRRLKVKDLKDRFQQVQVHPNSQEYGLHFVGDVTENVRWASERSKVQQAVMDDDFEAERGSRSRLDADDQDDS